jgi:hypothetical protein
MSESGQATLDRARTFIGKQANDSELRGLADVAMVQPADLGKLHDLALPGA